MISEKCPNCGRPLEVGPGVGGVGELCICGEEQLRACIKEKDRELAEARAENESAQAAWETRYSILVAALVSIAGSDTIGVHSEYIRMKAEARRVLEGK